MDNTLTQKQIQTLLTLQNDINTVINTDWVNVDYPYSRAIFMEIAEAIDHHGWKWWTVQEHSLDQVRIELIDALHFSLSAEISLQKGDLSECAHRLACTLKQQRISTQTSLLDLLELICVKALTHQSVFAILCEALHLCDLNTGEHIVELYIKKNTLALYRLRNGYREGTYNKIWGTQEDNCFLDKIHARHNCLSIHDTTPLYKKIASAHKINSRPTSNN